MKVITQYFPVELSGFSKFYPFENLRCFVKFVASNMQTVYNLFCVYRDVYSFHVQ